MDTVIMMYETPLSKVIRKLLKVLLVVVVLAALVFGIQFYLSHGYIEVRLEGVESTGTVKYLLTSGKPSYEVHEGSESLKKLVKKGEYSVGVLIDGKGSLAATVVAGRFQTSSVQLSLQPTRAASVVGTNPSECADLTTGRVLISWPCAQKLSNGQVHIPNRDNFPGYIQKFTYSATQETIRGVQTQSDREGIYTYDPSAVGVRYFFTPLDGPQTSLKAADREQIPGLSDSAQYFIDPYNGGLLAVSEEGDNVKFFSDIMSTPITKGSPKSSIKELRLYDVDTRDRDILYLFNQHFEPVLTDPLLINPANVYREEYFESEDEGHEDDATPIIGKSVISLDQNDSIKTYTLDYPAKQATLCSSSHICVLDDMLLRVYTRAGDTLVQEFTVPGVEQIETLGTTSLLVTSHGIVNFDIDSQTGNYSYVFDGLNFCGVQSLPNNEYLLCVMKDGLRVAVVVTMTENRSDDIDKQLFSLAESDFVESITAYGKFIYLAVDMGERTFQPEIGGFGYSSAAKAEARRKVNQAIKNSGIDRTRYEIDSSAD